MHEFQDKMDVESKKMKKFSKSDKKSIEQFYVQKYSYIFDVIKYFPRKNSVEEGEFDVLKEKPIDPNNLPERLYPGLYSGDDKRAKSLEDLQMRVSALKGKTKLSYKEKLNKKNLKNRLKKKDKKDRRKQNKSATKAMAAFERKKCGKKTAPKPVINNGQMIFSKFDFSESGMKKTTPYKNPTKDPEVALKKMKEEDEKLKNLKEAGETDLIEKIVNKKAWKTAFMKSEGVHIKDDPELLKKAIRKKKNQKERSLKKWEEREQKVNKFKEEKQKKRTENIQARADAKKMSQMKKAAKRGRIGKITAGF